MLECALLTAILAAPPAVAEASADRPLKLESVKQAYLSALQNSARRALPEPPQVVPPLVQVYGDLGNVEGLAHSERRRMRGVVKARLEQLRDKLIREVLRNKKFADRKKRRNPRARTRKRIDEKKTMLAAGGANAQAIALIDLIQNTIAPDTWQRVGGNGSFDYFDLLKVLVVRQTGEVHGELGGLLEQLRR